MNLPERLRELRAGHDWTLQELAERSGVNYVTIHRLERGSTKTSYLVVIKLAQALGVSSDYLLGISELRGGASREAASVA
jgi:transcriptional regulator with XRE-family HTH domain